MGLQQNKQVVKDWFERLATGNFDSVLDLLADDATLWITSGSPEGTTLSKAEYAESTSNFLEQIGPLQTTIKSLTAEEDRVSAETKGFAKLPDGRTYENTYHFLFVIREGKIRQVFEYLDTYYLGHVFGNEVFN